MSKSNTTPPSAKRINQHTASILVKVSRKVLFSFSELHSSIRRFTGFCIDKKITIKMVTLLYTTKSNIDSLVENLELMEDKGGNSEQITSCLRVSIASFKQIMTLLSENFATFVAKIDVCFIRMLYLTVYGSFNELLNAHKLLTAPVVQNSSRTLSFLASTPANLGSNMSAPLSKATSSSDLTKLDTFLLLNTSNGQSTLDPKHGKQLHGFLNSSNAAAITHNTSSTNIGNVSSHTFSDTDEVDEKLYNAIDIATTNAQVVFVELTKAISKSALASANLLQISSSVAAKVKELTGVCITSIEASKRLKTKLITIRNNPSHTTKIIFWEDVNLFLKAIIQTFSSVKAVMKDLPILNEIRASMATLTKATKEVTILIEVSSYKSMSTEFNNSSQQLNTPAAVGAPPLLNSIPSVSNIFAPLSAFPSQQQPTRAQSLTNLAQQQHYPHGQQNITQPPIKTPLTASLGPAAQLILPALNGDGGSPRLTTGQLTPSGFSSFQLGSVTAPQSTGQFYAKNGMNPFDGLILANREHENPQ